MNVLDEVLARLFGLSGRNDTHHYPAWGLEVVSGTDVPLRQAFPGSPQDGPIRISHSTVNLNSLIHHSVVTDWCEQQRERAWARKRDAKGCFFNIQRNWNLRYLACVISQAAHRLLMESCNRIVQSFYPLISLDLPDVRSLSHCRSPTDL